MAPPMQWLSARFCNWCIPSTPSANDLTPPHSNPNQQDNNYGDTYDDNYATSLPSMQQATRLSPLTLQIQPPLLASPHHPLFPPPTALLTTPPTSPFSPTNSNFVGIACAVPANSTPPQNHRRRSLLSQQVGHDDVTQTSGGPSMQGQAVDVMSGTLAVSGTPLQDGTGVAFVFRSLNIRQVGEWRVKIVAMQMSSEGGEARCCGEVVSTVVRVGDEEGCGKSERLANLCRSSLQRTVSSLTNVNPQPQKSSASSTLLVFNNRKVITTSTAAVATNNASTRQRMQTLLSDYHFSNYVLQLTSQSILCRKQSTKHTFQLPAIHFNACSFEIADSR